MIELYQATFTSRKKAYISRNMNFRVYINSKNLTNFALQKETKGKLTRVYFPHSLMNVHN